MRFFAGACALFIAAVSCTEGVRHKVYGPTSYEKPVDIPVDLHELSQAVGCAQQTYCGLNIEGQKVGDARLVWTKHLGLFAQRTNIYHSDRLGVVVAFEGTTKSPFSILKDANPILAEPKGCLANALEDGAKLMSSFQDAYLQVQSEVKDEVKKVMDQYHESRITVTGHSLGAAMATICGIDLHMNLHPVYRVFGFGCPRIGNVQFANSIDNNLKGRYFYIVNGQDWVPHQPPRDLGYQHASGQIWINPANSIHWKLYPGQENHHGSNSVIQKITFADHHGVYFHSGLGHGLNAGECPAKVDDK